MSGIRRQRPTKNKGKEGNIEIGNIAEGDRAHQSVNMEKRARYWELGKTMGTLKLLVRYFNLQWEL
jgi:hypothetical protein